MISYHLARSYLPHRRHSRMPRHHPVFWLSPWRTMISFRRHRYTFRMLVMLSALAQNLVALPMPPLPIPPRVPTSFRVHRHIFRMLVLLSVHGQNQVALPIPPLPIPPQRRGVASRAWRILAPGDTVEGLLGGCHVPLTILRTVRILATTRDRSAYQVC